VRRGVILLIGVVAVLAVSVVLGLTQTNAISSSTAATLEPGSLEQMSLVARTSAGEAVAIVPPRATDSTTARTTAAVGLLGLGITSVVFGARRRAPHSDE
jgi:hypothetical protein